MSDNYEYLLISQEKQKKLEQYRKEVAGLDKVPIRCPRCGVIVDMVYVDATGHKDIKCWKCKYPFITRLPYFRTLKKRDRKQRW